MHPLLAKLLSAPPHRVAARAAHKLARAVRDARARRRDTQRCTFAPASALGAGTLARHVDWPDAAPEPQLYRRLAAHYLAHRFDILGSGWEAVCHGMTCRGLEGQVYAAGAPVQADAAGAWLKGRINPPNLDAAQAIWRLVDHGYRPIDWQLDFKSGYRWSERDWYKDSPIAPLPGVDIKVPWELARMHHLAHLAHAWRYAGEGEPGFEQPERYRREFCNQVLDFMASNPPGFGVNWSCAMDVGIRVVNWLVAFDLFRASGAQFEPEFEQRLALGVHEHAAHIFANLEWHERYRGNHYLANIAGLLFAAAWLPPSSTTEEWLAFAARELVTETGYQFNADGSCFEASTAYHRLSAEMVAYATALALGLSAKGRLPAGLFPDWYWQRLAKMAEFSIDVTRPDGNICQIGDNDSGRLLKLYPVYQSLTVAQARRRYANLSGYTGLPDESEYLLERHLDHRHVVAAIDAFFGRPGFAQFAAGNEFETALLCTLAGGSALATDDSATPAAGVATTAQLAETDRPEHAADSKRHEFAVQDVQKEDIRTGLQYRAYPDFGLYIYRSSRLYLAVRCGPIGLRGLGAHAHNDALSIELWLDGAPLAIDPGAYVYTPLPEKRNAFRSASAHFCPRVDGAEPGDLSKGLFILGDEAGATCLQADRYGFLGRYRVAGGWIYRRIDIRADKVELTDWVTARGARLAQAGSGMPVWSDGYGWLAAG
jgi:hypothetical protein